MMYLSREGKICHTAKCLRQGFNKPEQCKWLFGLSKEKVLIKWKYFKAGIGLHSITWTQVNICLLAAAPALPGICSTAVGR